MARAYESWERLVTAVLREEDLRLTALRTPSDISSSSSSSQSRFFTETLQSFTYHQILQATDGLNPSNLIKHGLAGDLFSGTLDNGTPVVVKRVEKESLFISELEICGKVSHSSLVPLLGHCWELMNKKFLVYEYMYSKDLCLFRGSSSFDWKTRLKTAIRVAESLSYLHHECVPPLVHRNIEASSILLDDGFEARLGSLCDLCAEDKETNQNAISETLDLQNWYQMLFMRSSKEDTSGTLKKTTRGFDVYCFGKVLLELITGKLGSTTAKYSTITDSMAHFLAYVVPDNQKLMIDIIDLSSVSDNHVLTEIWGVSLVAKACLGLKSSKQPQMSNVLSALRYIESARFRIDPRIQPVGVEVSVNSDTITKVLMGTKSGSRNLRISEARQGEDGYLVDSFPEEGFAVKNGGGLLITMRKYFYKSVHLLKPQADILLRLSHPNLIKLVIYSAKTKWLLTVHKAVSNGCLNEHLFEGPAAQMLSMEIRVKILTGAARGMAFLHANKKQGFYEYFDTSEIFLDNSYNAKIRGFSGFHNPYTDVDASVSGRKRTLHMEKDVYGFGVVMFDMLTGMLAHEKLAALSTVVVNGEVDKIMDDRLEGKYSAVIARQLAVLALKCTKSDVKARPTMREVVEELELIESAMHAAPESVGTEVAVSM